MTQTEEYKVGKLIGETEHARMYVCIFPDGSQGVLKIALTAEQNGVLDREAFLIKTMMEEAERLEKERAEQLGNPEKLLNYQILFPQLVETFISEEQGGRRINILRFDQVSDDVSKLVPMSRLLPEKNLRIDPRTSAWILGKLLKVIEFAHGQGIVIGNLASENILIEPDNHYVVVFDWAKARAEGEVSFEDSTREIVQVAREVFLLLGGDLDTGALPDDDQLDPDEDEYANYLYSLVQGEEGDALAAHDDFYEIVRSLWPREFWQFTTKKKE